MGKKCAVMLAAVLFAVMLWPAAPVKAVSARSYALVEQSTGRVILGADMDARLPMASTTKIMTGLLACESGRLDETMTVPVEALTVEGSSMGLKPDEKLTLRDLVYGLMLESGNDAANAIAMLLGGSLDGFAAQMNQKAQALGLSGTHFANPSGLDAKDHYTTARDLARLGAYAMANADFAQIVGTRRISVPYEGITNGRTLVNHNRLLASYAGEIGIKTGFTQKSGRCLVSCARRDGVELVLVTLDDPDDWDDHAELLDKGFSLIKARTVLSSPITRAVKVAGGVTSSVSVRSPDSGSAALRTDATGEIKKRVNLPRQVKAPVKKGQKIGVLIFTLNGQTVSKADLTAVSSVKKKPAPPNPFVSFFRSAGAFFAGLFH